MIKSVCNYPRCDCERGNKCDDYTIDPGVKFAPVMVDGQKMYVGRALRARDPATGHQFVLMAATQNALQDLVDKFCSGWEVDSKLCGDVRLIDAAPKPAAPKPSAGLTTIHNPDTTVMRRLT